MHSTPHQRKHEHGGRSSSTLLDADKVLREAGVRDGEVLLDIGSGSGYFSLAAAAIAGPGGRIYAVDISAEAIAELERGIARKRGGAPVTAVAADAVHGLPLNDAAVTFAFMANVLHGFTFNGETQGALEEIARVLKPGGTLAVVEFKKEAGEIGPPIDVRLSPGEVERIVAPFGFSLECQLEAGPHHYTIVFKKL